MLTNHTPHLSRQSTLSSSYKKYMSLDFLVHVVLTLAKNITSTRKILLPYCMLREKYYFHTVCYAKNITSTRKILLSRRTSLLFVRNSTTQHITLHTDTFLRFNDLILGKIQPLHLLLHYSQLK